MGAQALCDLCKELESLGQDGSCEGAGAIVDQISEELASVQEALAELSFGGRDG